MSVCASTPCSTLSAPVKRITGKPSSTSPVGLRKMKLSMLLRK